MIVILARKETYMDVAIAIVLAAAAAAAVAVVVALQSSLFQSNYRTSLLRSLRNYCYR